MGWVRIGRILLNLYINSHFYMLPPNCFLNSCGADVAKWVKAVDCESTMRGFNSRRSPGCHI